MNMTNKEFAGWKAITDSSRDRWTEDEIVRLNGRGAMYFIGGEDGAYMRIGKDGTLEVGTYEGAIPHIGEAMFEVAAEFELGDYNAAFARALEVGGKRFLADMFSAPNQDELVKAAWARIDAEEAATAAEGDTALGNPAAVEDAALDNPAAEAAPPAYKLTQADMNEYGYLWPGMQPLTQEEALAHFDGGHSVLRLYPGDTEGYAESREEIEKFDGMFGFEIPGYVEPEIAEEPEQADSGSGQGARMTIVFGDGRANEGRGAVVGVVDGGREDKGAVAGGDGHSHDAERADGFTSVLDAIKKGKEAPKPPRKVKGPKQRTKRKGGDEI